MKRLFLIIVVPFVIVWHLLKAIPWSDIFLVVFTVFATLLVGKKTSKKTENKI